MLGGDSSSATTSTTNELAATASGSGVALTGQGSQNVSAGIGQQTGANYQEQGSSQVFGGSGGVNNKTFTVSGAGTVNVNDPATLLALNQQADQTIAQVAQSAGGGGGAIYGGFQPSLSQPAAPVWHGDGGGLSRWLPWVLGGAVVLALWRKK